MDRVGILHPGQMGISIAAAAKNSGQQVYWASQDRSAATRARAESQDLIDAGSLEALVASCPNLISICPPEAAETVAGQVIQAGFRGLYVDANAISPQRAQRIAARIEKSGGAYVDGGVIGGPAWRPGTTWLYLSGPRAQQVAAWFRAGPLETALLGEQIDKASALKMCFAAYTKGTTALLCAILGTAENLDVRETLLGQWSRDGSDFAEQSLLRVRRVSAKAWRFAGEMDEIAATFQQAGIPGEFHRAAAEIYRRLADFKNADPTPSVTAVLAALRSDHPA